MMHKNEEGKKAAVINLVDNLLHKNAVKERDNDVLFRTFSGKKLDQDNSVILAVDKKNTYAKKVLHVTSFVFGQ